MFWLDGCGAPGPPIEETGPAIVFDATFDSEQCGGSRFRPAAPLLSQPQNGMLPNDDVRFTSDGNKRRVRTADEASTDLSIEGMAAWLGI